MIVFLVIVILVILEIILNPNRTTCLAFNNFDRFIDSKTTAKKETLLNTVRIISQICDPHDNDYVDLESSTFSQERMDILDEEQLATLNTSKKKFEGTINIEFEPILKNLRMNQQL